MSDSNSDTTDSENNNVSPFFNHYLRIPPPHYEHNESQDLEIDSSSDSEIFPEFVHGSSSNDSDVLLHNTSEESYGQFSSPSHSSESSLFVSPEERKHCDKSTKNTALKSNYWCIPNELYNREIGNYKNCVKWSYKFYQSVVAIQKLKLSILLKGHDGCVNSLDFDSTGEFIASGSDDCRICLWNWSQKKCTFKYNSAHTKNIFQTKFLTSQSNTRIVSSARDGLVIMHDVNNCDVIYSKIIARHDRSCNKLAVHKDLPFVVLSCGEDGVVKNIDIRESPINENESITNILLLKSDIGTPMRLYGIDINPMKPFEFIINGNDEYIRMYDKRKLSGPVKQFRRVLPVDKTGDDDDDDDDENNSRSGSYSIEESHITSAVYNYCGTEILASYSEDDIYLFDANCSSDRYLHRYSGHLNRMTVKGVNFYGPKSDYVVSGSDCGHIFIWDKKTEAIVQRKHADVKGVVNVLEAHPHIPTLATSGLDKTIKIWEPLNKWQQPNKKKLRMCVVKNRIEREHRTRMIESHDRIMGSSMFVSTGF